MAAIIPTPAAGRDQPLYIPEVIISEIIQEIIRVSSYSDCLQLRLVNRYINQEVLRILFNRFQINQTLQVDKNSTLSYVDELTAVRYCSAFANSPAPLQSRYWEEPTPWAGDVRTCEMASEHLNKIHATLNEAVDSLSSSKDFKKYTVGHVDKSEDEISDENCIQSEALSTMCRAISFCLSPFGAWNLVHPLTHHPGFLTLSTNFLTYKFNQRPFFKRGIDCLTADLWVVSTMLFIDDINSLKSHLKASKVVHADRQKWLNRLDEVYGTRAFYKTSSQDENRWLTLLALCIQFAVQNHDLELLEYFLKQDPGTSSRVFISIFLGPQSALEIAIQNSSIEILRVLLTHQWLKQESGVLSDYEQYPYIIGAAADLTQDSPHRDETLHLLLSESNAWQNKSCLYILLSRAARNNDVHLAETIRSLLIGVGSLNNYEWHQMDWDAVNDPLAIAAVRGHSEVVKSFLMEPTRQCFEHFAWL